jgi:hypothetical protein
MSDLFPNFVLETPEQYKKHNKHDWPDKNAVYYLSTYENCDPTWLVTTYGQYKNSKARDGFSHIGCAICATEAGCPPENWRPEV